MSNKLLAATLILYFSAVNGLPSPEPSFSSYIIALKDGIDVYAHLTALPEAFNVMANWTDVFRGYAASLDGKGLEFLQTHPDVKFVEEDLLVEHHSPSPGVVSETLKEALKDTDGSNLHKRQDIPGPNPRPTEIIYVIDSGIHLRHEAFAGYSLTGPRSRAFWVWPEVSINPSDDWIGTGTYAASLAVGIPSGAAQNAFVGAVQVITPWSRPSVATFINAIEVSVKYHLTNAPRAACFILFPIALPASAALDEAALKAISNRCHFVAAAGDNSEQASLSSPGRVREVITIGALDLTTRPPIRRARFSNFGIAVDCFYSGVAVKGAWIGSTTATNSVDGTAAAAAQIAGHLASIVRRDGNVSPAELHRLLLAHVTRGPSPGPNAFDPFCNPW